MGTEILRPQDCLIERIGVTPAALPRRRSYCGNPTPNQNYDFNPRSRKPAVRVRADPRRAQMMMMMPPATVARRPSAEELRGYKMEKVTILRRGESYDSMTAAAKKGGGGGGDGGSTRKSDVYAGSAFAVSPEPSELPLPSFSRKAGVSGGDDSATRDLRRLLRLD